MVVMTGSGNKNESRCGLCRTSFVAEHQWVHNSDPEVYHPNIPPPTPRSMLAVAAGMISLKGDSRKLTVTREGPNKLILKVQRTSLQCWSLQQ